MRLTVGAKERRIPSARHCTRRRRVKIRDLNKEMESLEEEDGIHQKQQSNQPEEDKARYETHACQNYAEWGHRMIKCVSTQARDAMHAALTRRCTESLASIGLSVQLPEPSMVCNDRPKDCLRDWDPFPDNIKQRHDHLQGRVNRAEQDMLRLEEKMERTRNVARLSNDSVEYVVEPLLRTMSQLISVQRNLWQMKDDLAQKTRLLRIKAVHAMIETGQRIYVTTLDDLEKALRHFKKTRDQLDARYNTASDPHKNHFLKQWNALREDYERWNEQIDSVLPTSLRLTSDANRYMRRCDALDDDCFVRQLQTMEDHVRRIVSNMQMEDPDLALASFSMEWDADKDPAIQSLLKEEEDLQQTEAYLLRKHTEALSLPTNDKTIQVLSQIDSFESQLRERQTSLFTRLQTARMESRHRMECHMIRSQDDQSAVSAKVAGQAQLWIRRLHEFQMQTTTVQERLRRQRRPELQDRQRLRDMTIKYVKDLHQVASERIDEAMGRVVTKTSREIHMDAKRYQIKRNRALQELDTFKASFRNYVRRVATHETLGECMTRWHQAANRWEEAQKEARCIALMMQETHQAKRFHESICEWFKEMNT